MNKIRYLFKNITLLNLLLAATLALMAHYTILPLLNINVKYRLPSQKKISVVEKAAETEHQIPSPSDYIVISEENLFHPERRIPPEKKEEVPLPKPDFVLYGTLITDTVSLAYIEDLKAPRNSPGRGKRQIALKKGDTMSGFMLKEIDVDKIVMMRGEEKMIVPVSDTQRAKTPAATATPQPASIPQQPQMRTRTQRPPDMNSRFRRRGQLPGSQAPTPPAGASGKE